MAEVLNTEEEAKESLDNDRRLFYQKMCPVFHENCRGHMCHAFFKGIYIKYVKGYKVFQPACTSPLVTGEITFVKEPNWMYS